MAQEQNNNQIPSTVRDFIASEMVRRGLGRQEVKEKLVAEIQADEESSRSREELEQLLEDRVAREDEAIEVGPGFWKERKRLFFEKRGLQNP